MEQGVGMIGRALVVVVDDHGDEDHSGPLVTELLTEAGFSSLNFNGIASRAGVSTGTFEREWNSKLDLVIAGFDPSLVTSAIVARDDAVDALAQPPMKLVIDCIL